MASHAWPRDRRYCVLNNAMKRLPTDLSTRLPQEIRVSLIAYLESLQRRGIRSIVLDSSRKEAADAAVPEVPPDAAAARAAPRDESAPTTHDKRNTVTTTIPTDDVAKRLADIAAVVAACTDCGLHEGRTKSVFGVGTHETKVMFIGEGPGRDEDLQGEPFVGRSGQLLTKILAAIDLERSDVYITNIVKCRPPNNRDPQEEEVRCCEKYLVQQIELIRPKIIVALGRIAAHWLLQTDAALAELRKNDNFYRGTPVLVTYHPAALLRNPALKKNAWEDFKRLRAILE